MKKCLHIISHSHWDREWYMGFEQHRVRLVELMDALIDKMESDPQYRYFHLDGHVLLIEDYLEIRPEKRERLEKLIRDGRIQVGPWYILQDEFLTSGEANVRNMLEGLRYCEEHGYDPVMTGYFPDAFGNISQAPQILNGFGIDNAVFGRGMGIVFEDNKPAASEGDEKKELNWISPDGSSVIGVMFTDWYNNANELPTEKEAVREVYGELIQKTIQRAGTPHLLGMNGCDHQPLQKDLTESLDIARQLYGDEVEIRHSNFKDYIQCIRPYKDTFPQIHGEITGQFTSGALRLVDTATTHVPLKLYNHKVQNMLQQQSEPISVMANLAGDSYRDHLLHYAWKTLMKNHPHDSICSCSCDAVAREMAVRFEKAYQVAEYARDEAAAYMAAAMDTMQGSDQNIVVFHTSPKYTEGEVCAKVHLESHLDPENMHITDWFDRTVGSSIRYLGKKFTYTLPKDSFRKVRYLHTYEVRFPVSLSGLGYFVYKLHQGDRKCADPDLRVLDNGAENDRLRFQIQKDGTINLLDKSSGRQFYGLHRFEDSGDCGDGYNYWQTTDYQSVFAHSEADCVLLEQTPYSITYEVITYMDIPVGLTEKETRTEEKIPHEIHSKLTLRAGSGRLEVETTLRNKSENHRLRVLFPNDIQTDKAMADGQFDVLCRDIQPWRGWTNPSNTQRMQAFFGLEDAKGGMLIASRGLCSYEILRDGKNTMALDLLRAVGQIGDWGDFPAPQMQIKQELTLNYSIIPYSADEKTQAFENAYAFAEDRLYAVQTGKHTGRLQANKPLLKLDGSFITCNAVKQAENKDGIILRVCNVSEQEQNLLIDVSGNGYEIYETNLAEKDDHLIAKGKNLVSIRVMPKKIKTYRLK